MIIIQRINILVVYIYLRFVIIIPLYVMYSYAHMRDKLNVNNNYILTSYIGSSLLDYNTALMIS